MKRNSTLAMVTVLLATACSDVTDPIGADTYDLVEGNGEPVPAVVFDGETQFGHTVATAVSGTLTLRDDGSYTERVVFGIVLEGNDLGEAPVVVHGTWAGNGQVIDFFPDRAGSPDFSGTLSGNTLTTTETDPDYGPLTFTWQL